MKDKLMLWKNVKKEVFELTQTTVSFKAIASYVKHQKMYEEAVQKKSGKVIFPVAEDKVDFLI